MADNQPLKIFPGMSLAALVKKYVRHVGQESMYEFY
jgi:hypothetical protein